VFAAELEGFDASESSFAFPYNQSSPELEGWLSRRVRAFRTGGDPVMPLPRRGEQRVTCVSFGPERCGAHLVQTIESFVAGPSGWLCYNLHGLDDEGWGPVGGDTLDRLLERLVERGVRVLPITAALEPNRGLTRPAKRLDERDAKRLERDGALPEVDGRLNVTVVEQKEQVVAVRIEPHRLDAVGQVEQRQTELAGELPIEGVQRRHRGGTAKVDTAAGAHRVLHHRRAPGKCAVRVHGSGPPAVELDLLVPAVHFAEKRNAVDSGDPRRRVLGQLM